MSFPKISLYAVVAALLVGCSIFWYASQTQDPINQDAAVAVSEPSVDGIIKDVYNEGFFIQQVEEGKWASPNHVQRLQFEYGFDYFSVRGRSEQNVSTEMRVNYLGATINNKQINAGNAPVVVMNENNLSQTYEKQVRVDYTNTNQGMRQDFVLLKGPKNLDATIKLEIATELAAEQIDPYGIRLSLDDEEVMTYSELKAYDAKGKHVRARMSLSESTQDDTYNLEIKAWGDDLAYPVTIDPLTQAAWSLEEVDLDTIPLNFSVAGNCDVDMDGIDDVIIGFFGWDQADTLFDVGQVRIYLGDGTGLSLDTTLNGTNPGDRFGYSVDCAGDVNGDGYDDIIVGAYLAEEDYNVTIDTMEGNTDRDEGEFYIFYGSAGGITTMDADTITGTVDTMRLGFSVSRAGDVNNDTYDDVIVGAPTYSNGQEGEGVARIYQGSINGLVATPLWEKEGGQVGGNYGYSVSGAGDVNGDMISDVVVGAYSQYFGVDTAEGRAFVFYGADMAAPSTTPDWSAVGPHKGAKFGISVSGAGDVNDDGNDDLVIGASSFAVPYKDSIIMDTINTIIDTMTMDTTYIISQTGVVVTGQGGIFIYHGSGSGPSDGNSPDFVAQGPSSGTQFGRSVSDAGDVNGDGIGDVLVGAPAFSEGEMNEGAVYAYYGSGSGLVEIDWMVESDIQDALLGSVVANAGDINDDNVDDIIIGSSGTILSSMTEASAFAYYGNDSCGLPMYGPDPVFLTFPTNDTLNSDPGACGAIYNYDLPTADDNCGVASVDLTAGLASGELFPVGTTTVTYTVTNVDGLTTDQSFLVTVYDVEDPMIVDCNTTLTFSTMGGTETVISYPEPTFSDNCGPVSVALEMGPVSGTSQTLGVYDVVHSGTDPAGNQVSCTFRVAVLQSNSATNTCNFFELQDTIRDVFDLTDAAYFQTESRDLATNLTSGGFGANILFQLVEGILGIDIPDFVEQLLGVGGSGIDLAFVSFDWSLSPGINMDYYAYNDIHAADSGQVIINYPATACINHPQAEFFGCRDTISFSSALQVESGAQLQVEPGVLQQEIGFAAEDLRAELAFSIGASVCIGIPNPLPVGPDCVGYRASFNKGFTIFNYTLWEGGMFPIIVTCDDIFEDFASYLNLVECAADVDIENSLFNTIVDAVAEGAELDGVTYDPVADNTAVTIPPIIGDLVPIPLPEFDFTFGRMTAQDLGSTSVVGDALRVTGTEDKFSSGRFDLLWIADLAIWVATGTLSDLPPCIGIGTTINLGCGLFVLDVADLNLGLRNSLEGSFEFNPTVEFDQIDLGIPQNGDPSTWWWQVENQPPGTGQIITGAAVGDNIRLYIPDEQTEEMPIDNLYRIFGDVIVQTDKILNFDFGIRLFEIGGDLFGGGTIFTLVNIDPVWTFPLGSTRIQDDSRTITFPDVPGQWILNPDDSSAIVFCFDTTVFLNEWGLSFVTPESVYDSVNSYDRPIGGTGMINLIEVYPDTITCDMWPGVPGFLVTEDDNCNYDTCEFFITVMDTLKPYVTCQDITVELGPDGTYEIAPDEVAIGAIDNCAFVDPEITPPIVDCGVVDMTVEVAVVVTDIAGNTSMCTALVQVVDPNCYCDDAPPMVFCDEVMGCNTYVLAESAEIKPDDFTIFELEVANDIIVSDVNVRLAGTHESMGDLTFELISPDMTTIVLFGGLCVDGSGFDLSLDDQSAASVATAPCDPLGQGSDYMPQDPFATFNGLQSGGTWQLRITSTYADACGLLEVFELEICGNDASGIPVLVSVMADPDQCSYQVVDTTFDAPFTDGCNGATITHNYILGPFDYTLQGSLFPVGQTSVIWTAVDNAGNVASCEIIYEVLDTQKPEFENCPRPDIMQDAEPAMCGAFVNYSPPVANDNCGSADVTQIDMTGLTTGDVFPVGMTILEYEAMDPSGNTTQCSLRVIVNDKQVPLLTCPENFEDINDIGECGAVVTNIAPVFSDNCMDNLSITYEIEFPEGSGDIVASGTGDASGEFFNVGSSVVTYNVTDQPAIIITEATQEIGAANGGMNPVPYTVITGDDYVEVTNFGPAAMNVSELIIERISAGLSEVFTVPNGNILLPGETLVLHYGNGTDDPNTHFYNLVCSADLASGDPSAYVISFNGRTIDVVALNGFDPVGQSAISPITADDWSGDAGDLSSSAGLIRNSSIDHNDAEDWVISAECDPLTIGMLNPSLEVSPWNNSTTALQDIPANEATCSFTVTISDTELPYCTQDGNVTTYFGGPRMGDQNTCNETIITVPIADDCVVGDIDVSIMGTWTSPPDLIVTLSNPAGESITLMENFCPAQMGDLVNLNFTFDDSAAVALSTACGLGSWTGAYQPQVDMLSGLWGSRAAGEWVLRVEGTTPEAQVDITSWTLDLTCLQAADLADITVSNDEGDCGAVFSWIHPWFTDNCNEGMIEVSYTTTDADCVPADGLLTGIGGSYVTETFCVGTTTITYTLTDAAGNVNTCGFSVTIDDDEAPVVVCPNDIIVNLASGECETIVNYTPASAMDNCDVVDTVMTPPSGSVFGVGTHEVIVIIFDQAGNSDTCSFNVIVNEHPQNGNVFTCNDLIQLSLGTDCTAEITPDMLLEGDNYTCFDYYCVEVLDPDGNIVPNNIVTLEYLGDTLQAMVSDCNGSTNSCWGLISVEDKLNPVIACPDDITIGCYEEADPLLTGTVELLSCELSINATFYDEVTDNGPCGIPRALRNRIWTVVDESGNSAECEQGIKIRSFAVTDVDFPADIDFASALNCQDVNGNPFILDPSFTGIPMMGDTSVYADNFCQLNINYYDETLPDAHCATSYVVLRHWSVFNTCLPPDPMTNPKRHAQAIHVRDRLLPSITPSVSVIDYPADLGCKARVDVRAILTDVCSSIEEASWEIYYDEGPLTQLIAEGSLLTPSTVTLDLGLTYRVVFSARDDCDNIAFAEETITIDDVVPPVPLCDEHTIVTLTDDGPQGLTLTDAAVFDDESYDNCSDVTFRARRMDSCIEFDWTTDGAGIDDIPNGFLNSRDRGTVHRPKVPFACCDVDAGPIMVELEVTDASGNVNYCMVEVEVQDKLAPYIECPPDVIVSCEYWFDDDVVVNQFVPVEDAGLNVFGTVLDAFDYNDDESVRQDIIIDDPGDNSSTPVFWGIDGWADDNCNVELDVITRMLDDCSSGNMPADAPEYAVRRIERTFRARDGQNNTSVCQQEIYVVDFDPFDESDITWPRDIPSSGCTIVDCPEGDFTPENLQAMGLSLACTVPNVGDDNCSLVGISYTDSRFDFVEDACFKILREWTIIDWCQYDVVSGTGIWNHTQVIKVQDATAPVFEDCPEDPITLCVEDEGVELTLNNQVFVGETIGTSCSVHLSISHVVTETCSDQITYDIKVYPFNGQDFVYLQSETTVTVVDDQVTLTASSKTSPVASIRANGLPYNSPWCDDFHRVLVSAEDGCGNLSTCEYLVRLEDCKKPSPVCINGLSTVVMPQGGTVVIWASEYNASSIDDCTPTADLLYSFSGDEYIPSMEYNCDNVPAFGAELGVQIWVADGGVDENCNNQITWNERNKDFCVTTIVVTDNDNFCEGSSSLLSGEIMTYEDEQAVDNTSLELTSPNSVFPTYVTIEDGYYQFIAPHGDDYTITPDRNDDHKNGVSTLDLIEIQKHLIGISPFENPYDMIAADANNSESISGLDLVEIRKLILGIYSEFPNNQSWRFIDRKFEFDDPSEPWPFVEAIGIENLQNDSLHNDFMAVKVGDVNNTVVANASQVIVRNNVGLINMVTDNREVKAGEIIDVSFRIEEAIELLGYQFTMNTKGLQLNGLSRKAIDIASENIGQFTDQITMSWHNLEGVILDADSELFTLEFVATINGQLSEMLSLNSEITTAEAYNELSEILDIDLVFTDSDHADFALYQNQPNPFDGRTQIGFDLPRAEKATLTVVDIMGRVVYVMQGEFAAGYNKVELDSKSWNVSGVLYYRLETEDNSATKKMLVIKK